MEGVMSCSNIAAGGSQWQGASGTPLSRGGHRECLTSNPQMERISFCVHAQACMHVGTSIPVAQWPSGS